MKLQASNQMGRTNPESCKRSFKLKLAVSKVLMAVLGIISLTSCADFNEYQRWVSYHEAQRQGYGGYGGQYAPGYLAQHRPAHQPSYQRPPVATSQTTSRGQTAQKGKTSTSKKVSWDYRTRYDTRTTAVFPNGLYWVIDRWNRVTYYGPDEYKRFKLDAQKTGKKIYEHEPYHGQLAGVPPPPN